MRITILTCGSRGDVQPYIALGVGLQAAGHQVRVATHEVFADLVAAYGLELSPIQGNPRELLESGLAYRMLDAGGNPFRFFRDFSRILEPFLRIMIDDSQRACEGAEAVIFSGVGAAIAFDLAEQAGVPYCVAQVQPSAPTRAFASPFFADFPDWLPFGRGAYNRWTHHAVFGLMLLHLGPGLARARRARGLPRLNRAAARRVAQAPVLFGCSPSVVPRPPDWEAHLHLTGYWFLEHRAEWQPPPALVDFLAGGPAPVYIGFGSMRNRNPEEVTALAVEALARSGQRGVLFTGWGGFDDRALPETVIAVESVPHDWLFPRMAAVVHHGGAGTTAAGLRSGVPSIVVPFFADQPFWGRRVEQLGVGPRAIPRKQLTAERLATAIRAAINDPDLRTRAALLGERIRGEDGVGRTVELFEQHVAGH
jgi:sterol 3beta-glucosyltransferase